MIKPHTLLALAALALIATAQEPASEPKTIEGWGTAVNPAEDCKFNTGNGRLTIDVPDSSKKFYDLAADFAGMSAPRVLAPVKGDFVIQVKVDTSSAAASEGSGAQDAGYYSGAGLVVFADEKNFVRLERAALFSPSVGARLYTNFELREDGKVKQQGNTGDLPPDKSKPVWLRLERKGAEMHGSMSQDGEHWEPLPPKELRDAAWDRDNIRAGVAAISCGKKTSHSPSYSDFSVRKGQQDSASPVSPK